jgi:predicted transcriptional regulator
MPNQTEPTDPIVAELTAIKRLLVSLLMRSGASQEDVAKALGITQGTVSKMFNNGKAASTKPKTRRGK